MNNDGREAIIVPEKREKIERIKRKYEKMSMTDDTAKKIRALEITNNVLAAATGAVGILTVVNYFVPDPIPGVDEAVMTGVTALLGSATSIVSNKIKDLAATGSTDVKMEEVTKLSEQMGKVAKDIAEKRKGQVKTQ